MRAPRLRLTLLLVATLWSCAGDDPESHPEPEASLASPAGSRLNVLLITVDTLRADALGSYGQEPSATPWMDRLAAEGVRFANAHAHNVVTAATRRARQLGLSAA